MSRRSSLPAGRSRLGWHNNGMPVRFERVTALEEAHRLAASIRRDTLRRWVLSQDPADATGRRTEDRLFIFPPTEFQSLKQLIFRCLEVSSTSAFIIVDDVVDSLDRGGSR